MNLEKANADALAAALAGDLDALKRALGEREDAIQGLASSADSLPRMEAALRAGEQISRALFALKQRIGSDSARLTLLAAALSAGMGGSCTTRGGWVG